AEASAGAAPPAEDVHRLREVLDLARRAGVPAAGLLRRAAEDVRDEAAADGLVAAERLAVRLVLPLGVCILPAFVFVGVVPVVVGVLSSTVGGAA
ncbi:pilus assembly protein TadB, partial [Curtobacterium flaccumfaciens]|nr:pilus assembly protein TadB [Curtobacterium flaccumfaciens]